VKHESKLLQIFSVCCGGGAFAIKISARPADLKVRHRAAGAYKVSTSLAAINLQVAKCDRQINPANRSLLFNAHAAVEISCLQAAGPKSLRAIYVSFTTTTKS
jgi:hypothetical protein